MAKDKIVLAELDVDTRKLVKSMQNTAEEIEKLTERQEKLKNKGKETSAEFLLNENTLKRLNETYKTQTAAIQAQTDAQGKLLSQKKAVKDAMQEINKSENEYLQSNERLLALKKNLDSTDKDYEKNLARINGKLQENNKWLKENGSAFTKVITTMNDYKQQAIDSFNSINVLNGGFSGLVSRAQEAGGVGPLVKGAFEGMSAGIGGMTKSALTFIATPFGMVLAAIAAVIALVQNSMDRGTQSSEKLTKVFTTFSLITDRLMGLLEPLGDILIDGIAAGFDLAGKAAEAAMGWIADGLELLGFEESAEGVRNFTEEIKTTAAETHNLKAAQEKLAAQMAIQEVNNEKAKQQIDDLKKKYEDQTATEQERIEALKKAEVIEKENLEQRKAHTDEAYNIAVRNAALNKGLSAEERQNLQKQGAAYAEKMMKVKGFSQEEIDALKKAQVEKMRIGGEETKMLQRQADAEDRIYADAEAKRKAREHARRQKAKEKANELLEQMNLELQKFIQAEDGKAKTLEQSLKYAQDIQRQKLAVAEQEFKASEKTANDLLKLEIAKKQVHIDYAKDVADTTAEFAQAEIELWKQKNQSLIKDSAKLTKETIDAEAKRISIIKKMQIDSLAQENDINQKELDDKIAKNEALTAEEISFHAKRMAIAQQYDEQIKNNNEKLEAQTKAEKTAQLEIDKETRLMTAQTEYDAQLIEEQAKRDEDIARYQEQFDKKLITEDQFIAAKNARMQQSADEEKRINNAKELAVREQYANTFGQVSQLLGKKTVAGKAAAIAEATINTYNGITQVWASDSILPEPIATIAKGVSTAAVVASGLAAVSKIKGTNTPKAEKGALFSIGGRRHSEGGTLFTGADGTQFEAEQGELIGVMNRNAARHFMAFNNAFPAGGSSAPNYFAGGGIVSREMATPSINADELAIKIAEANRSLPAPVVAVQDIVIEGNSYVQVRDMANF